MKSLKCQYCVKKVLIQSFSGPYFPVFGLNTDIYFVNLCIRFEYGKIRTRKNSVFGHFSCSAVINLCQVNSYQQFHFTQKSQYSVQPFFFKIVSPPGLSLKSAQSMEQSTKHTDKKLTKNKFKNYPKSPSLPKMC